MAIYAQTNFNLCSFIWYIPLQLNKSGHKLTLRSIAIYAHLRGKYSENLISPGINLCSDKLQFMLINVEM